MTTAEVPVCSLVIPVYGNELNIGPLVAALEALGRKMETPWEVVFVIDGSPDNSESTLRNCLPTASFPSQLISLSRNFGSFAAIRAGLARARGQYFAVLAADLQEPPELVLEFFRQLRGGTCDVTIGQRTGRSDGAFNSLSSRIFWGVYRRLIMPEVPKGGVDVFGCNEKVRRQLLALRERNSSLVGLLFWIGFRRLMVPYDRAKREAGRSAWTFSKKLRYLLDSVYGFTDLPIRWLSRAGALGMLCAGSFAAIVLYRKLAEGIPVPGYTPTVLLVTFFGGLNCFGLGLIGSYVWRAFENSKMRPTYVISETDHYQGRVDVD